MEHASAVRVGDGLADVNEPVEQMPEGQRRAPGVAARVAVGLMERLIASSKLVPRTNRIA